MHASLLGMQYCINVTDFQYGKTVHCTSATMAIMFPSLLCTSCAWNAVAQIMRVKMKDIM